MENVAAFTLTLFGLGVLGLYLLPALLELRLGRGRGWVVALNVATGWTVIGWFVALGVALAGRRGGTPAPPQGPVTRPAGTVPTDPGALVEDLLPPPRREAKSRSRIPHG
jgi:hypothetical protein